MLVSCTTLKNGKVFTGKFVGTGPSSYEKRIYRAAVSQSLRNTDLRYGRQLQVYCSGGRDFLVECYTYLLHGAESFLRS